MNFFGADYEIASHTNLKRKYFVEQLTAKEKPKVTAEMLKKLGDVDTLFGKKIKIGDMLVLGLIITGIVDGKTLTYNFFYCTSEELKQLGTGQYYASATKNGIPKIIDKTLIRKYGK